MVTFDFKRTGPGLQRIIDGLPGAAGRGVQRALDDTAKLAIRLAPNVVGKCIKVEMLNSETGEIDGRAVAQVAAVGQIHAQNGVPRLRQCEEGRQIGVSTGVGLNIGILAAE